MRDDRDDGTWLTSELYRRMPPHQGAASQLASALNAASFRSARDALDAAGGTSSAFSRPDEAAVLPAQETAHRRSLTGGLKRAFGRVDVWILITGVICAGGTVALLVIALLTLQALPALTIPRIFED
jgi:hypothetical protein